MGREIDREQFMKMALTLARRGRGKVNPNPMVGAVVVKNGEVLGMGYHRYFGGPHAEVQALEKSGGDSRGADMYVSMEPCSHFGKTPPCTDAIIAAGIQSVFVATKDPNPVVCGKGISALRRSGIEVSIGLLRDDAEKLNIPFFKFMERNEIYVTLKMAITADGFIADSRGRSKWITTPESRLYANRLRACHDAVLVGIETIRKDNPSLNVRLGKRYRQPLRVVVDPHLEIDPRSKIFREEGGDVLLFTYRARSKKPSFERVKYPPRIIESAHKEIPVSEILAALSGMGVTSLFVEGGAGVYATFLNAYRVDKLYLFVAGKFFGTGLSPFSKVKGLSIDTPFSIKIENVKRIKEDIVIEAIPGERNY